MDKPVLGITPRYIAEDNRLHELMAGVLRYAEYGQPVPVDFYVEMHELISRKLSNDIKIGGSE